MLFVWVVRTGDAKAPQTSGGINAFRVLACNRRFLRYAFAAALMAGGYYCFAAGAPHVAQTMLGYTPTEFGIWMSLLNAAFFAGAGVSIVLGPKLGINGCMLVGAITTTASAVAMLVLLQKWEWSLLAMSVCMVPWAVASGIFLPNAEAGVLGSAGARTGTASALAAFLHHAIAAAVMQSVGALLGSTPYPMVGCMLACSGAVLLLASGRTRGLRKVVRRRSRTADVRVST